MSLDYRDIGSYVEEHIGAFHAARLRSLEAIRLTTILKRKNPYLFRAKNIRTAEALVKSLFDAYLSSQEETIFGEFLEGLAIFIAGRVYGGHKSSAVGVDLELTRDGIHYLVAIKSGPNWGNSSQIAHMRDNFATAKRVLNTNRRAGSVVAVNGCCYGRDNQPDKGDYLKYCGQRFWEFISGDAELYVNIIEPLGHQAREKNEAFEQGYARVINLFSAEFMRDFASSGDIDWLRLVQLASAAVVDAKEAA
jgi:hypothetical protein